MRELSGLIIHEFFKNAAFSLIGVFIPVYILDAGYGLTGALGFLLLQALLGVIGGYPVSRLIDTVGIKHALVISYGAIVPSLLIIKSYTLSWSVIVGVAVLYQVGRMMHRIALQTEFAIDSSKDKRARDSGRLLSLPNVARIVSPVIGGAVFATYGFASVAVIALGLLGLSAIPLFLATDHTQKEMLPLQKLWKLELTSMLPLLVIRGIQATAGVGLFSLYIFTIVGGAIDVGGARALDSLGFVSAGLFAGYLSQKVGSRQLAAAGGGFAAVVQFLRGVVVTPFQVFLVSFIGGICFQMYHVPLYSMFANEAERVDRLVFSTLRNICAGIGKGIVVLFLLACLWFFELRTAFQAVFALEAVASALMAWLIWRR